VRVLENFVLISKKCTYFERASLFCLIFSINVSNHIATIIQSKNLILNRLKMDYFNKKIVNLPQMFGSMPPNPLVSDC